MRFLNSGSSLPFSAAALEAPSIDRACFYTYNRSLLSRQLIHELPKLGLAILTGFSIASLKVGNNSCCGLNRSIDWTVSRFGAKIYPCKIVLCQTQSPLQTETFFGRRVTRARPFHPPSNTALCQAKERMSIGSILGMTAVVCTLRMLTVGFWTDGQHHYQRAVRVGQLLHDRPERIIVAFMPNGSSQAQSGHSCQAQRKLPPRR